MIMSGYGTCPGCREITKLTEHHDKDLKIKVMISECHVTPDGNVNRNGIHLEKLKGSRGAQNYVLDGIDIEKYSTVVIYCQPFGAYFASSSLT